jgi:hypothetical protein
VTVLQIRQFSFVSATDHIPEEETCFFVRIGWPES